MPVPDFQTMMLPFLELLGDGKPHQTQDISAQLAQKLKVSEEDRMERLPSGLQTRWANRLAWIGVHLKFAQLIQRPARGQMQITERGLGLLKQKPARIDLRFLRKLPGYEEARSGGRDEKTTPAETSNEEAGSPLETLEASFADLRRALVAELLDTIKARSPQFFENLVLDLMQKLGYGKFLGDATEHLGRGGDRGLDGLIKEDKLGLEIIYLQAKRWDSPVGPAVVREFLGALDQAGAKKGVLITTSTFTKEAKLPSNKSDKKISLIDGVTLAELMIDHDLGVTAERMFQIKRLDSDYFEEA